MINTLFIIELVFLVLFTSGSAFASSFNIAPIKIFMENKIRTSSIELTNNGDEKVTVQLSAVRWSQEPEGKDTHVPTKDIVFFPKILPLEKGEMRTIRIGYQGEPSDAMELTYRLFLEDLPARASQEPAVMMTMRLSVPIFIKPLKQKGALDTTGARYNEGKLALGIKNSGNCHFVPHEIKVSGLDESGKTVFTRDLQSWYLLPGISKTFEMEINADECSTTRLLLIAARTEDSKMEKKLTIDKGFCSESAGQ